jgi:hypothetical protein
MIIIKRMSIEHSSRRVELKFVVSWRKEQIFRELREFVIPVIFGPKITLFWISSKKSLDIDVLLGIQMPNAMQW